MAIIKKINCFILLLMMIVLCNACSSKKEIIVDRRVHDVSTTPQSIFKDNDFSFQSLTKNESGFDIKVTKALPKRILNGIYYVSKENDATVDVEYYLNYKTEDNILSIIAEENSTNYYEETSFYPQFTSDGLFDGSIIIDGKIVNLFDYSDEGEYIDEEDDDNDIDECFFLTATIFGVAVWKIALVATAATVACVTLSNPTYVDSLSDALDSSLNNISKGVNKIVIGGITFILAKATAEAISTAKKQEKKEYYIAVPITEKNVSEYPDSKVGMLLLSNYPITKAQAKTYLQEGINCYTYTAKKAKKVMSSAFPEAKIKADVVTKSGYYPHYHAYYRGTKVQIAGNTMHSFYGEAVK